MTTGTTAVTDVEIYCVDCQCIHRESDRSCNTYSLRNPKRKPAPSAPPATDCSDCKTHPSRL